MSAANASRLESSTTLESCNLGPPFKAYAIQPECDMKEAVGSSLGAQREKATGRMGLKSINMQLS